MADDQDITVEPREVEAYFDGLPQRRGPDGKRLGQRKVATMLGVTQSTISRNGPKNKRRKKSQGLSDDLYKIVEPMLIAGKREEQRRKHMQPAHQALLAEDAIRPAESNAAREHPPKRSESDRERRIAEREQERQQELSVWQEQIREADIKRSQGVMDVLEPYWKYLRELGIPVYGDYRLHGDALWLVENANPEDIKYPDMGVAIVALAPDDHLFSCGRTAAQLRAGITAQNRLQGRYPVEARERDRVIPLTLRPDAKQYYPHDYAELVDWQRSNVKQRTLAENRRPLAVSLSDAGAFRNFATLHKRLRNLAYTLRGACLDEPGIEIQLRRVNVATVPLIASDGILMGLKWMVLGTLVAAAVSRMVLLVSGG